MKRCGLVAVWFAGVLCASNAFAQSVAIGPGDVLLHEGVDLRRQGRDADALDRFTRAYATDQSPIALAQMGLAEQALGHWVESEAHVREALAIHDNIWIDQNRGAIEQAYAVIQRHVGSIDIIGGMHGAVVTINGTRVGVLPLSEPVRTVIGPATVQITAPGYLSYTRVLTVPPNETVRETITLAPERGQDVLHPLSYASFGIAGVSLIVGLIGVGIRESNVGAYNNDRTCPGLSYPPQPTYCQTRIDTVSTMTTVEVVGFVGAGLFAAAGATLWYFAGRNALDRARRDEPARLACGGGPGTVGITCAFRY